jgi:hypothetical protein
MGEYSRVVSGAFAIVSGNAVYVLSGIAGEGVRGDNRIVAAWAANTTGTINIMYAV